ncbi:MAG: type III-A CRISPR-associated RAMP protein Csm5 [Desulfobacula sp.]|nr:type III-A CRISPR-associated RAMP protein Csm5 [Desulfobacula sp.]
MNKQTFRCYIKTLSPIHIGCDEVYVPTGFVLDEATQQMIVFNPLDFISSLSDSDRNVFNDICSKGTVSSILEIYQFLRNKPAQGRRISVCKGLINHYNETLSMKITNERKIQQELNNFLIFRTAFSSIDQRPYLPGSSVKGTLRTAYLNLLEKKRKLSETKNKFEKGQYLEKALMGYKDTHDDPFRLVKVSDFMPVGDVKTKIVYGVNKKKKPSKREPSGMTLLLETVQPGSIFEGVISVQEPEQGAGINQPVSLSLFLKGASEFYLSEKKREDQELSVVGLSSSFECDNNTVLLRCGRHSGAESVTVEGHRSIKIMGKRGERPKYKPKATTFWLASDAKKTSHNESLDPFGWSALYEMKDDLQKKFSDSEQEYQNAIEKDKQRRMDEIKNTKRLKLERIKAEEEKAKIAEKKIIAEEKRKTELGKMSPEQRLLAEFDEPSITENRVVEIFNKLDDLPDEDQKKIAYALKKYWTVQGKWKVNKKKKKNKKFIKVKKIKIILGDG